MNDTSVLNKHQYYISYYIYKSSIYRLYHNMYKYILVGGIPTPMKNMKVSWDDDIPYIWKKMFRTTNVYIYIRNCFKQVHA
jgi:hypothetical protein